MSGWGTGDMAQRMRDLVNGLVDHDDLGDDERIAMHRLINQASDADLWRRRAELCGYTDQYDAAALTAARANKA